MGIHTDSYTYMNKYRMNLIARTTFPLLHDITKPEVRLYRYPSEATLDHNTELSSLLVLFFFSFLHFGIPVIISRCVWPDDDRYRNAERAQRISLHRRRSKYQSRAIKSLDTLFDAPESCCYNHPVTVNV
jgi:hypothetical protein